MLDKAPKKATELAELIRRSLGKPELRVAVFATKSGWKAKVYPEGGESLARVQGLVDKRVAILSEQYEFSQ